MEFYLALALGGLIVQLIAYLGERKTRLHWERAFRDQAEFNEKLLRQQDAMRDKLRRIGDVYFERDEDE